MLSCMQKNVKDASSSALLDEYIQAQADLGNFSGAVLVAQKSRVVLRKAYGFANYELDVPNTPIMKFRIGSITKQFTAVAIMQLQERGLLNVNDPLIKYIPDYPRANEITIHHLLTHSAGIPNITALPDAEVMMKQPTTLKKHN